MYLFVFDFRKIVFKTIALLFDDILDSVLWENIKIAHKFGRVTDWPTDLYFCKDYF